MRPALPPATRPPWLIFLACLTLGYGGLLLVTGLATLGNPQRAAHMQLDRPLPPAGEALVSQLATANSVVIARHQTAIRVEAAASVGLALLMLYAAAATLSRDRLGRAITLAAAWVGIVYQVATLPLAVLVRLDFARAGAPLLAELLLVEGGRPTTVSADTAATVVRTAVVGMPVMMALLGMAGSALLIRYFGGRRGRALYGLEQARGKR